MRHANNVLHRLPCGVQGFPLSGKTQHQVVTRVADGGSVANLVNAHKIMVCYDPDDPQDTLFEMWPTHVPEEALNNFRWLKANYTAPDEYKFLFNPKEIIIKFKEAVECMTRGEILAFVGKSKHHGGDMWPPFDEYKKDYKRLLFDMKRSAWQHSPEHTTQSVRPVVVPIRCRAHRFCHH